MKEFIEKWKSKQLGREKQDCHPFWLELIRVFCQIDRPENFLEFEVPVKLKNSTGFIDVWIPSTKIIIEQKTRGKVLDKSLEQSDTEFLNPYQQAKRYDDARAVDDKANWIITSNFDEIWIYNLHFERPDEEVIKIALKDLPNQDLRFLTNPKRAQIYSEELISAKAGGLVQKFRDLFLTIKLSDSETNELNRLCIQLVFCLYAEDSNLFQKRQFLDYLESLIGKNLRIDFKKYLERLFKRLDTKNLPDLVDEILEKFPYVDGELFKNSTLEIIDKIEDQNNLDQIHRSLINVSANFNWHSISPTIFGAIFESIMNPDTKRADGIHYTSPENIHKVIDPLFLDDLNREFETCNDLEKFHDKIANLKFLDPACGSGNFLTETYISLRKLEDRIIAKIGGQVKISIENFYGIEINDFAVQIAKLALWISEHQMNPRSDFLPLTRNANIIEGNSLELDWKEIVPDADFIIGNPPYAGSRHKTKQQAMEIGNFFDYKDVDYVACWIKKSAEYIRDSKVETGFVTTNSITQGEQVFPIWQNLFDDGIKINFAKRSFRWENEAPNKKSMAHVHCVIFGFARFDREIKTIDGVQVQNINGYLLDAPNVCIRARTKPIHDVPRLRSGNMLFDNTNLVIEANDLDSFVERDPRSKKFIKRIIGAEEFIHNLPRYVLWLVDAEPNEIKSIKPIYERVEACRKFRESGSADAKRLAKTPWLFREQLNPNHFIVIPKISSERREYVPMGYLDSNTIANATVLIIPDASISLFGILTSSIHMAWMRAIAGRLETRYIYSASLVYNNFPFPKPNLKIEITAQKILDARSNHPNSSLADLYDPNLMPSDLRKAHDENDRAVLDAYGFPRNISESEIVSRLFSMYEGLIQNVN